MLFFWLIKHAEDRQEASWRRFRLNPGRPPFRTFVQDNDVFVHRWSLFSSSWYVLHMHAFKRFNLVIWSKASYCLEQCSPQPAAPWTRDTPRPVQPVTDWPDQPTPTHQPATHPDLFNPWQTGPTNPPRPVQPVTDRPGDIGTTTEWWKVSVWVARLQKLVKRPSSQVNTDCAVAYKSFTVYTRIRRLGFFNRTITIR